MVSRDNVVELQTGKQLHLLEGHTELVESVALQGDTVVSGSINKTVRVWDLETGKHRTARRRVSLAGLAQVIRRSGSLSALLNDHDCFLASHMYVSALHSHCAIHCAIPSAHRPVLA